MLRRPRGTNVMRLTITLPEWAMKKLEIATEHSKLTKNKLASQILETYLNPEFAGMPLQCPKCGARFSVMVLFKVKGCPQCKYRELIDDKDKNANML